MNTSNRIKELGKAKADLRKQIEEIHNKQLKLIEDAMYKVAEMNPNKIEKPEGKLITMVVRFSDLQGGKPWVADYYDWKESVRLLFDYLKESGKPVETWKEYLQSRLENSKDSHSVYFEKFKPIGWVPGRYKAYSKPISRELLKKIVEVL